METKILIGVGAVILFLVVSVTAASYLKQKDISEQTTPTSAPIPPTPTPEDEIPEKWELYKSEKLEFSINYPPEVEVNEQPDGTVNFSLLGPTQKEGTEFYDGLAINIEPGTYTNDGFEDFVNEKYEELENDRVHVSSITPLEETELNGNSCYKFTTTSTMFDTSEVNYLYIQKAEVEYILVSSFVSDPTDQGFEEASNKILSTLEF